MMWIALFALAAAVAAVIIFNDLVAKRNDVRNGWSQIDVQLKRRHDLVPQLVDAARAFLAHEKEVLERVAAARAAAAASGLSHAAASTLEENLTASVRSLRGAVEAYPQLVSSRTMQDLQEELTSTENRIAFARQFYNDSVAAYNTAIQSFPQSLVASAFAFTRESPFAADIDSRAKPAV